MLYCLAGRECTESLYCTDETYCRKRSHHDGGTGSGKKRNCDQCLCHRRRSAVRILHTGNHHESLALVESGICDRERNQQGPEQ